MLCGVGHQHGSDPTLLWLWCRPGAIALIGLLDWEPPSAVGTALKRQRPPPPKKTKKTNQTTKKLKQKIDLIFQLPLSKHFISKLFIFNQEYPETVIASMKALKTIKKKSNNNLEEAVFSLFRSIPSFGLLSA